MTSEQPLPPKRSGEFDPSFGNNGLVQLQSPTPDYPDYVTRVIRKGPDGKTYIAGLVFTRLSRSLHTLIRLDENGSIDTSFGKNGWFYDYFHGSDISRFSAEQIAFADGRILVSGTLFHYGGGELVKDKAVVCFLPNGTIDDEFGENGKFIFHAPNDSESLLEKTAYNQECFKLTDSTHVDFRQPSQLTSSIPDTLLITNNYILLVHDTGTFDAIESFIIRVTLRGALDQTFNDVGFVRVSHEKYPFLVLSNLSIDDAGNYISGGQVRVGYQDTPDAIVLVKHTNEGRLDTGYQQGGFLLLQPEQPGQHFSLHNIVKQPNNRTLCVGIRIDSNAAVTGSGLLISREADGSSNIQFNNGQPVFTTINSSNSYWFNADFLPDGSFLTTGLLDSDKRVDAHYVVSRFFYNGVHDKDYGNGAGWVAYKEAKIISYKASVITNNKIVFSVESEDADKTNRAVARGLLP
ncbi:delta-60 repeat domain-containing protein [Pseudomonas sp. UMAB-40]|uniref:delta-60 repeat domain-containing protein n=1 Tax=Pseudomonas sp. UMAB-40 TaxID=1365407 RepID=UPI001C56E531|nr:delta-60 repeat domain-containing protein [Pseudomonas sp. UMAB-40]